MQNIKRLHEKKELNISQLPDSVSVTVVVATLDRPADLTNCLRYLRAQRTSRTVDIIVVDNNPMSGQTPPVVDQFPEVRLSRETRRGLSYARNAGIRASQGEIVVTTDDDVTMPDDWLEKLVAPFVRKEVMIVTGNVLPLELETPAQRQFEMYGGLGRGFERKEVGRDWFDSFRFSAVRTWDLGATANAAFRAKIFWNNEVGLLPEELGPGTPTGVGEDTYIFYRALKSGLTILYEPTALVWHRHRRDLPALRRQIYNYSKGHVAYNLLTFFRDHDIRGLVRVFVGLPLFKATRIAKRLLGRSSYPLGLIFLEIAGNLAGPFALLRSHFRVRRDGRS